ncbi:MAG: type II toxin-antitoxin system RelE/ParE family toxin [Lachnospiraceae bacterium]|nr:type II toxin-antitoxin system RelE/ParE family toxin [Lachnospiraceae bacterium]
MSEKFCIFYSPEALDDIRKIYSYIAFELQVPETAQKQVARIRKEIRTLDFMPLRHPLVDWEPWKSIQMHSFPVDNYVVYYTVDSEKSSVVIIRIFYSGRDVERIVRSDN